MDRSNIASVAGTIAMRIISGWLCEKFGARRAFFGLLMLPVPGIIGIAFTQGAAGMRRLLPRGVEASGFMCEEAACTAERCSACQ